MGLFARELHCTKFIYMYLHHETYEILIYTVILGPGVGSLIQIKPKNIYVYLNHTREYFCNNMHCCLQNEDWDRIFGETARSKPAHAHQQETTPTSTPIHGGGGSGVTSRPHGGSKSSDHSPERQRSPRKKELPHQLVMAAAWHSTNIPTR